jgi:N-acetylmuramoyl-L-alanine amidase
MASYHAFDEINENTPASIIEAGFLNLDRQFLTQNPDIAAQGIADGILCFIRNESITPPTSVPTSTP